MATRLDDAETQELRPREDRRYAIEVKLENGDELRAHVGGDLQTARTQLASIQASGAGDGFVFLGEDTVVRSREIRYARIVEGGTESQGGIIDTVKQHVGGGSGMATYDTDTGGRTIRAGRHDEGGAHGQPLFGGSRRGGYAETKPFFLTSEFLTLLGTIAAVAIAMAVLDNLDAERGWLLITILAAAYMVSRGIAKAGTRDPNTLDPR